MCAGYFLVLLDVTIVNVALPRIGSGLHAGVSGLQWVVDGYAIALAALMLGGGTVGDLHGHKRIVLAGFGLFGLASLGCGFAQATGVLVGFRVLQGMGAALMLPGTLAVITSSYPDGPARARAIGIWAGIGSAALPAGPLLGGALTQAVSWRAIFFLNVPIVAVAVVIAARAVRESTGNQGRRLDVAGIVLGATLLALTTFAFIEVGHRGIGVAVAVAICAAVIVAVAFSLVERGREDPMLPLALFRRPAFSASNAVAGTMNLATLGLLFVLTLYLQDVRGLSALAAGTDLLPLFLPLSLIAPVGGRITGRIGPRRPMLAGLLLAAVGVALLTLAGASSSYWTLLPALLLWGLGLALLTPAVVAAALGSVAGGSVAGGSVAGSSVAGGSVAGGSVADGSVAGGSVADGSVAGERAGLASAVNNTARQAAGAVGIAAFGALAGSPAGHGFLTGFHAAAIIAAGLFGAAALATVAFVRSA
jgi:DHA2 family methylenomycin A resistance protein-like MFS transporter